MRPSEILKQRRDQIRPIAARYPVENLRVFGSVASGEDHADSDLDLLVDARSGTTLFQLGGLQDELETALGIPVHLTTPGDLRPAMLERILKDTRAL